MSDMLEAQLPEEPPEYSVLCTEGNRSGSVWQRYKNKWYPALYREHGVTEPREWADLISYYGRLRVLRWGGPDNTEKVLVARPCIVIAPHPGADKPMAPVVLEHEDDYDGRYIWQSNKMTLSVPLDSHTVTVHEPAGE